MRSPLRAILEEITLYRGEEADLLARLVTAMRPPLRDRQRGAVPGFNALLELLNTDAVLRQGLADYLERLLHERKLSRTLLDAGMPLGSFWFEVRERLIYKVLPYQPDKDTVDHVLVNVFFKEMDGDWVGGLDTEDCVRFLELMNGQSLHELPMDGFWMNELLFSAQALALRIAGRAFDSEVLRMVPEYANLESPFVALQAELDNYLCGLRNGSIGRGSDEQTFKHLHVLMGQGSDLIEQAYRNSGKFGIGFRVNQHLMMMERMLDRLAVILRAIGIDARKDGREATVALAKDLVHFSSGSTRLKGFLDRSTQVIAREVTQHAGRKGEHYITSTAKEYMLMFRSALWGGAIVAVACLIKVLFSTWEASLFGHAFLYSLNYAGAFITIYLLHFTLATKQPAMTAATLAASLDYGRKGVSKERYAELADLMARVWRSQFIAFVGNVFMAFPVALLMAVAWNALFGTEMLADKAPKLIHELDPFLSLALLHAAFAGVFLFLSGLIAGNATNSSLHRRIPQRIEEHPALKHMLTASLRKRIADHYARNFGGVISNLWFGVFMGSLGTVGFILGVPLDIRHITFAAGNLALGLVGNGFAISYYMLFASILGIGLIGFVNFFVSFGLSLMLALRSRGIPFKELAPIVKAVRARFLVDPRSFFFPPGTGNGPSDNGSSKVPPAGVQGTPATGRSTAPVGDPPAGTHE